LEVLGDPIRGFVSVGFVEMKTTAEPAKSENAAKKRGESAFPLLAV